MARNLGLTVVAALALAGCPHQRLDDTGTTVEEVGPGVYALSGIDADGPYDDLRPLGEMLEGVQVVGLGEAMHTSGGFYRAKTRVFRYLVEEQGFRAFAFETPWDDAQMVSEYVATCEGDPEQAVRNGIFGVFQDESVAEVARWMCAWNQEHPDDPVYFTGYDIQQGWDDGRRLRAFLQQAVPAEADALYAGLDNCTGVGFPNADAWYASAEAYAAYGGQMDPDQHAECMATLEELAALFDTRHTELVSASSEEALAWARISLMGLVGWELQLWEDADCALSYEVRDEAGAYVLLQMRELLYPGARTAVWAHNSHIAAANHEVYGMGPFPNEVGECQGWKSTGTFVREEIGDEYAAIGLFAYETEFDWFGDRGTLPGPVHERAVERMLHGFGRDYLLVDTEPTGEETFLNPGERYQMGDEWGVPADQYRAILYLEHSEAMNAL
jgi:erythromycin esterase